MRKIKIILPIIVFLLITQTDFAQTQSKTEVVNCNVCNNTAIYLPKPEYPKSAINSVSGMVDVRILINEQGIVESAKAISGHTNLRKAAEKAALESKFKPLLLNKTPVKVNGVIIYKFILENKEKSEIPNFKNDEKRAKISQGGICNGKATYLPKPEYPEEAKSQGIKGTVSVQILIDKNGDVESAKALSNHPLLRTEAEKVALKAKFKQVFSDGTPTKVGCVLVYFFTPENSKQSVNKNETKSDISKERPRVCGGGVRNSVATYFPQPEYPKEAKEKNISGVVTVMISIDEEGNVTKAEVCSGHPLLRHEAEKAAMKAKFKPTKLSGQAVKVSGIFVYNFNLSEEKIIKAGIVNGKATYLPPPDYPKDAETACASGKVEVEVLIDEKAETVVSAKAISGDELLQYAAVEAAKKAKFRRTPDVMPVKVRGILVYSFDPKVKCLNVGIVNKLAVNIPKPNAADKIQAKNLQIKDEGIVAVQIVVDSYYGNVIYAKALLGHPLFRAVYENVARQTKFRANQHLLPIKVKALLVYKFKPDGTAETDVEKDDKDVIGTPINLVKPPPPFCNCRFGDGGNSSVFVEARIDTQGNVTEAKAINGHPILKNISEKAALESKFLPTNIRARLKIVYKFEGDDRQVKISDVYVEKVEIEK